MSNETEIEKKQREDREFSESRQQGIDDWTKKQEEGAKYAEQQSEAGRKYYETQQEMLKQQQQQQTENPADKMTAQESVAQAPIAFEKLKADGKERANNELITRQQGAEEQRATPSQQDQRIEAYREAGVLHGPETQSPSGKSLSPPSPGGGMNEFEAAAKHAQSRDRAFEARSAELQDQAQNHDDPVQRKRAELVLGVESAEHKREGCERASFVTGALGDERNSQRFAAEAGQHEADRNQAMQNLYEFDKAHGLLPEKAQQQDQQQDQQQGQQRDQEQDQQQGPQQGQQPSQQRSDEKSLTAVQPAEAPAQQKPLDRIRAQNAGPNPDAKVDPEVRKYAAETKENIAQAQAQQARSREQEKDKSLAHG